jgi:hypothetical protein
MCAIAISGSSIKANNYLGGGFLLSSSNLMKAFLSVLLGQVFLFHYLDASSTHRISYYKNGEIHVNQLGQPDKKPLTSGHWDFKPSWSKTGDKLVFFRRLCECPRGLELEDSHLYHQCRWYRISSNYRCQEDQF